MKTFLRFFSTLLLALIFLSALAVKRGGAEFPASAAPQFDAQIDMSHVDKINANQPQIILLGDSMVEENVNLDALILSMCEIGRAHV